MSNELERVPSTSMAPASADPINTMVEAETLTTEESQAVEVLAKELETNFLNEDYTSSYGASTQIEVAQVAKAAIGGHRIYQLGNSKRLLQDFQNKVEAYKKLEAPRGLSSLVYRIIGEIKWYLHEYEKITDYIEETEQLFKKEINELKVSRNLNDRALEANRRSRRALIVHIVAGKQVLKWAREVRLLELQAKANESKAPSDVEETSDFAKACDIFELKIGALNKSLAITYFRKPEIDMLRDSERLSIATFEDLVNQAIPTWILDMALALGVKDAEQANENAAIGRQVTEGLLRSNAERIGQLAKETVKNAEAGFVRTEVIIDVTNKLLTSIAEVGAAFDQAIANSREYEKDLASNTAHIQAQAQEAMAS